MLLSLTATDPGESGGDFPIAAVIGVVVVVLILALLVTIVVAIVIIRKMRCVFSLPFLPPSLSFLALNPLPLPLSLPPSLPPSLFLFLFLLPFVRTNPSSSLLYLLATFLSLNLLFS